MLQKYFMFTKILCQIKQNYTNNEHFIQQCIGLTSNFTLRLFKKKKTNHDSKNMIQIFVARTPMSSSENFETIE